MQISKLKPNGILTQSLEMQIDLPSVLSQFTLVQSVPFWEEEAAGVLF